MKDKKNSKNNKNIRKAAPSKRAADPEKKGRMKYYAKLSGALLAVLIVVALGMFLYLRYEAKSYRNEYAAELSQKMEESKDLCIEVLESMDAGEEVIANINTQYANAMLEDDILQQYYLVDGIMDYSLSSLYTAANLKHQEVALNGGAWVNYDDKVEQLIDAQAELKTVKEQISSIDLDNYY